MAFYRFEGWSDDVIRPDRLNSIEDAYRTITVDTESHCITGAITLSQAEIKPFKCPCCGGNSYKSLNGKIICEYCDTEFMR